MSSIFLSFRRHKLWIVILAVVMLAAASGALWAYSYQHQGNSSGQTVAQGSHKPPPPTPLQCIAKLPTDFLAGQVLMVGLPADQMSAQTAMFTKNDIGGAAMMTSPANPYDGSIITFKKSAGSLGIPLLVATDEEGGMVQRFSTLGALPSPEYVATTMTPTQAQQMITAHSQKLKAVGIDMIFGPLADVAPAGGMSPLGNRVFSSNPAVVQRYALAYVRGWQAGGLLPTIKHFPGMGSASGNTDYVPATTPPLAQLKQRDFIPYEGTMSQTGTAVMVGNQNVPGWFSGPASLSPVPHTYLRLTLGYKNNLLVTDSLSAQAITSTTTQVQAAVQAIAAGSDIALIVELPNSTAAQNDALFTQMHAALVKAVQDGTISKQQLESSVLRKLNAQHVDACSIKVAATNPSKVSP
ncbi:MAG TPA: glycoside hydrolase family 3 N-terminal domain-containing protein [Candidatus Saccharimonadales bacterium]|nr:glycoside hydrolase family 3 N-terminal domain-containing protein [Candidatus Saccharimonadales bacterium]